MYNAVLLSVLLPSFAQALTTTLSGAGPLPTAAPVPAGLSGPSVCGGQPVLEACLLSTTAIANACSSADYQCLCDRWKDVATCYSASGCPNDPRFAGANSNSLTYCNMAVQYSSTTPKAVSSDPPSTSPTVKVIVATTVSASKAGSDDDSDSDSETVTQAATTATARSGTARTTSLSPTSATETGTGNSGVRNLMLDAGGMMVGLAGLVGVLL